MCFNPTMKQLKTLAPLLLATCFIICAGAMLSPDTQAMPEVEEQGKGFDAYWNSGKAEITTYDVQMARYGDMHPGKTVMVYVTEPFLVEKQVKKENAGNGISTQVLKLNKIDRFTTGIYDYSLMLSTFSPIDRVSYPFCLKSTFSAQDWCGQTFMQLNRRGKGYQAQLRSYFESEGDKSKILESVILEDELWTLARLDPRTLPIGDLEILPSSQQLRLRHEPIRAESAKASLNLEMNADQTERYVYTVTYDSGRSLSMRIQSVFPYQIYSWEEKVKSGFGPGAKWLTTKATLDKTIKSSYWGENSPADTVKRAGLGLD